jgi:hypothetical protein
MAEHETPVYTVSRVANIVTALLATVRTGQCGLDEAEARILSALSNYQDQQRAMAAIRDAEVTANTEGKVTADPAATSAKAARLVEPRTGTQRAKILTWLVEHNGATDYQLSVSLGLLDSSTRPRRGELVAAGYVRDSGIVREHYGSPWSLWEATPSGHDWYIRSSSKETTS